MPSPPTQPRLWACPPEPLPPQRLRFSLEGKRVTTLASCQKKPKNETGYFSFQRTVCRSLTEAGVVPYPPGAGLASGGVVTVLVGECCVRIRGIANESLRGPV